MFCEMESLTIGGRESRFFIHQENSSSHLELSLENLHLSGIVGSK